MCNYEFLYHSQWRVAHPILSTTFNDHSGAPSFAHCRREGWDKTTGAPSFRALFARRVGWRSTSVSNPSRQLVSSPKCCPVRLDLHDAGLSGCIMTKTGPRPVFRFGNKAALYGIPVHIAQLLDALFAGPYIEVIVPALPELGRSRAFQLPRGPLFQYLNRRGQGSTSRLAEEQMDMLRHQDITGNNQLRAQARPLQRLFKGPIAIARSQQWFSPVTAECHEVKDAALLITDEALRHDAESLLSRDPTLRASIARRMGHPMVVKKEN